MFGPPRRILGIGSHGCDCYLANGSGLILEAHFVPGQAAEFASFIRSRRGSVFIALADQLEEDFRQDAMPFLRGPARSQLLARKATQVYRDTPFHSSASLGRDTEGRRDERIQLMALTNAEALSEWLTPLSATGVRVSGLYSPPLIAPGLLHLIARRTGARPRRLLLVSVNRSGLRQILVDGEIARFSRLAAVGADEGSDAEGFADACLTEVNKTQQYLVGLRLLVRDSKIPTLIIVPPGKGAAWSRPGLLVDAVDPVFIDLEDARRAAGLKQVKAAGEALAAPQFADSLWIFATRGRAPRFDFAPLWLRESYRVWQARVAISLIGAAVLLGGVAVGIDRWAGSLTLRDEAQAQVAQTRRNLENYERIKRGFPPLPAAPEQLRASVTAFEKLAARTATPAALMAEVGKALEGASAFRLDKLEWQLSDTEAPDAVTDASQAPLATGATTDARPALFEVVTLQGSITVPDRGPDARLDNEAAQQTALRLRQIRGATVAVTRLPLNLSPTVGLNSDSVNSRVPGSETAAVAIRISRKVGS